MLPAANIEAGRFGAGGSMDGRCAIYHGDAHIVAHLELPRDGWLRDFGYGFYGTESLRQPKRGALTLRHVSVVTCYVYTESSGLDVLSFPEMSEEWLDFIVSCRRGSEHDHDIFEGTMSDEQIW